MAERRPYEGSTRRERLPDNWQDLRAEAERRNPDRICHWCGKPGGTTLDHIKRGDDHSQDNLDWIHDRQDVIARRSTRNCHGEKTGREGAAARPRLYGDPEPHPAFD